MSRSSPRSGPDGGGDRRNRAQTEPIAALVALLAIGIGIGLYAVVAVDQTPDSRETDAEATMQLVVADLLEDGVFDDEVAAHERYERPGQSVRISFYWSSGTVTHWGSEPPDYADVARRPMTQRRRPGEQTPAVVVVQVWES